MVACFLNLFLSRGEGQQKIWKIQGWKGRQKILEIIGFVGGSAEDLRRFSFLFSGVEGLVEDLGNYWNFLGVLEHLRRFPFFFFWGGRDSRRSWKFLACGRFGRSFQKFLSVLFRVQQWVEDLGDFWRLFGRFEVDFGFFVWGGDFLRGLVADFANPSYFLGWWGFFGVLSVDLANS